MKIQCDVCSRGEASVFCCADEAALCDACDRRVHHANKLASKHRRFSLSSAEQAQPLCDICKERRGFVFCQEDRAILCRDCDDPIHTCNQLTMKHCRFLLTGSRLSATPLSSAIPLQDVIELDNNSSSCNKFKATVENPNQNKSIDVKESSVISTPTITPPPSNGSSSSSSSSISEYLIKTIPGYCVEDFLVDDANGLYKNGEMVPFSEPGLALAEKFPIWVPHVPQVQSLNFLPIGFNGSAHCNYGFGLKELNQNQQYQGLKVAREELCDDSFMVPEINTPVSSGNQRPRPSSAWDF